MNLYKNIIPRIRANTRTIAQFFRHPGEGRDPGCTMILKNMLRPGSRVKPGMTMLSLGALFFLVTITGCKSTYTRAHIESDVVRLAQEEYGLTIDARELNDTVSIVYLVDNLSGEMFSSDQDLWKKIENILMVMRRVTLSIDDPPEFFVLDVMDRENPAFRFIFTRYVSDVKKVMAEVISVTHYFDSMLIEVAIADKKKLFDMEQTDITRLIIESINAELDADPNAVPDDYRSGEVNYPEFLAKVAANRMRRMVRDKKDIKESFQLRDVNGSYGARHDMNSFSIILDLIPIPGTKQNPGFVEKKLFPQMAEEIMELFRIYKFQDFSYVTLLEKNSGKILTIPRK